MKATPRAWLGVLFLALAFGAGIVVGIGPRRTFWRVARWKSKLGKNWRLAMQGAEQAETDALANKTPYSTLQLTVDDR